MGIENRFSTYSFTVAYSRGIVKVESEALKLKNAEHQECIEPFSYH
jgi:hypothetical protein